MNVVVPALEDPVLQSVWIQSLTEVTVKSMDLSWSEKCSDKKGSTLSYLVTSALQKTWHNPSTS